MSDEDLKAELERLRNENAVLKKGASSSIRMKVSDAMACTRGFDDRRFALLAPTTPRVMIRAHVGCIAKEDLRFFPLRQICRLHHRARVQRLHRKAATPGKEEVLDATRL